MPDTAVVWFRRDLRVRDLPALAHACREHERVVPLFVFDPALLGGRFRSHARTAWMLGCLEALDGELRARGGRLVSATGARRPRCAGSRPRSARAPCTSPTTSPASRGRATRAWSRRSGATECSSSATPASTSPTCPRSGPRPAAPYTVYSPFLRAWKAQERRPVERAPAGDRDGAHRRGPPAVAARAGLRRAPAASSRTRPSPARTPRGARRAAGSRGGASRATPSAATSWPSRPRACRPTCASAASRR